MTDPHVSAIEAQRLLLQGSHVYLDVRTEQEFELGHPLGAYNVPWLVRDVDGDAMIENPDFMLVMRTCFPPGQPLIVGCERGDRSRSASRQLGAHGYAQLLELRAGYGGRRDAFGRSVEPGWRAAGLPCASEALPGRDYPALLARAQSTASGNG